MGCSASSVEVDVAQFDDFIADHRADVKFCASLNSGTSTSTLQRSKATAELDRMYSKLTAYHAAKTLSE